MKLPNLGQGSVHGLGKLIHAALLEGRGIHAPRADDDSSGAGDEEAADDRIELLEPVQSTGLGSLLECFEVAAKMLREAEQHVWRSRLGFQCPQATLQELGDAMGLTRERIRQIERKAFSRVEQHAGWAELSYRLNRALKGRTTALFVSDLPALDPWFAEATSLTTALVGAVHQILPDRFDAFQIRGAWVVSHLTRHEWQEVCHLARSRLESGAEQGIDEVEARSLCDSLLDGKGEELRGELWSEATANALWSAPPGQTRKLVSFGRGAEAIVRAVLASSDQPLHFTEIHRRAAQLVSPAHEVRYIQNAAAAVGILFQRGTYGMARHCPLSSDELALVRAEAEDVVSGGEAGRQWHPSEVCDALLERGLGFDGRLTKYVVNYALEDCKQLVYLRRMVWGLGSQWQAGAASRLDVRQAVIDLLQKEGRPMTTAEVREQLAKVRGLNQTFQIVPAGPLVRIGPGLWGLLDRDVDVHAVQPLVERLRAALLVRQAGLHVTELPEILGLPPGASVELPVLALAQAQGVRIDRGQYAYLGEWGTSRRVSVPEAVTAAFDAVGSSGLTFDELCGRVNASTQRDVPPDAVHRTLGDLDLDFDPVRQRWSSAASAADEVG